MGLLIGIIGSVLLAAIFATLLMYKEFKNK
jgi:hypothetical protein